ncbi:uncharacterized protein LOC116176400 isoform X2 [Photinus pyralis]|uniref:uncharacterized protein LOC116176400 isoform X2 n=1 Tax=Photinus pyralis TaxID=7054 RepID=UPI00126749C8|nr:uncharacterized protein LOC116176400 isoform X2 [Photinus pyralis]
MSRQFINAIWGTSCVIIARRYSKRVCGKCYSLDLTKHVICLDFLRKLRVKPGIGRSRRYYNRHSVESSSADTSASNDITMEKLFQLDRFQIQQLFGKKRNNSKVLPCHIKLERGDLCADLGRSCSIGTIPQSSPSEFSLSKKPIICPHGFCRKMVTISSFVQHFKYDHPEIRSYNCARGKELWLDHNVQDIEYNFTRCLAVIDVVDINQCETFWLMVSGSPDDDHCKAYVIYWLLCNATAHSNSTIELSSYLENISYSTFCPATRIYDSYDPLDVARTVSCLYVDYSSMCNIISEGPKLHLRIIIY